MKSIAVKLVVAQSSLLVVGFILGNFLITTLWSSANLHQQYVIAFMFSLAVWVLSLKWLFKNVLLDRINLITKCSDIVDGKQIDLAVQIEVKGSDEISLLTLNFNNIMKHLDTTMVNIKSSVVRLMPMSRELEDASMGLLQKNQVQYTLSQNISNKLNDVNSLGVNIVGGISEIIEATQSSQEAIQEGQQVVNDAHSGITTLSNEIEEASQAVSSLKEISGKIGSVIDSIHGIADQTNLLALNAAIEAARAGEAGRGFAVVADEVRNLSKKTQASTLEVEKMVTEIQEATKIVVEVMSICKDASDKSVHQINESKKHFDQVHGDVVNITDQTLHISKHVEQQNVRLNEVTGITHQINSLNHDIVALFNRNSISSTDLCKLEAQILSHIDSYALSKNTFDVSLRTKKLEEPITLSSGGSESDAEITLF